MEKVICCLCACIKIYVFSMDTCSQRFSYRLLLSKYKRFLKKNYFHFLVNSFWVSAASLLWVLSTVLMRISISLEKLSLAALPVYHLHCFCSDTHHAWNLHLSDLISSTQQRPSLVLHLLIQSAYNSFASPLQGLPHYILIESHLLKHMI